MMGVFDDDKFEKLDWMTQMTETIESDLNDVLAKLPEKVALSSKDLMGLVSGSTYNLYLSANSLVTELMKRHAPEIRLSWQEQAKINECFKLEVSKDAVLNMNTKTLDGVVTLIKTVQTFEDEQLQKDMGIRGIESLNNNFIGDTAALTRMNDIMELLTECDGELKNKSVRKKMRAIRNRLKDIFEKNEWRIRSTGLADKVGYWVGAYIKTGNLAAYTNFCKLKVMTHSNMPIYSIQEEPT